MRSGESCCDFCALQGAKIAFSNLAKANFNPPPASTTLVAMAKRVFHLNALHVRVTMRLLQLNDNFR